MANLGNFNADPNQGGIAPDTGREPIPAGVYKVMMRSSEFKATKARDGQYLQCELVVMEGPSAGRKIIERLNLQNKSQTTVEIAKGTLSAICHAAGVLQVQDSSQLHNIPMTVEVKVSPGSDNYDPSNEIKKYFPAGGTPAPQMQPAPAAPAPAPMQAAPPQQEAMPMAAPPPQAAPAAMPWDTTAVPAAPAQTPIAEEDIPF